jgi:hypothetical protein
MARTIAALFEDRGRAEAALGALMESRLAGHRSRIIRAETHASEMAPFRGSTEGKGEGPGSGSPLGLEWAGQDRAAFQAALERGGCLLAAEIVGDIDRAVAIVETFEPAELDPRSREHAGAAAGGPGDALGAGLSGGLQGGMSNTATLPGMGGMAESTHDSGSADLRTGDLKAHDMGRSTTATGDMRAEERSGAPGARELAPPSRGGRVRTY